MVILINNSYNVVLITFNVRSFSREIIWTDRINYAERRLYRWKTIHGSLFSFGGRLIFTESKFIAGSFCSNHLALIFPNGCLCSARIHEQIIFDASSSATISTSPALISKILDYLPYEHHPELRVIATAREFKGALIAPG